MEFLASGDVKAVGRGFDGHAHALEIGFERGDAVGFLDPQLGGVAHGESAALAAPSTASAGISSISAAVSAPSITPPVDTRGAHAQVADQLAARSGCTSRTLMEAPIDDQKIEQRGARGIQPHAVDHQVGLLHQQRGHQEEAGRGEIAGDDTARGR